MTKFKKGDRIQIVRQPWYLRHRIGKEGTVVILNTGKRHSVNGFINKDILVTLDDGVICYIKTDEIIKID